MKMNMTALEEIIFGSSYIANQIELIAAETANNFSPFDVLPHQYTGLNSENNNSYTGKHQQEKFLCCLCLTRSKHSENNHNSHICITKDKLLRHCEREDDKLMDLCKCCISSLLVRSKKTKNNQKYFKCKFSFCQFTTKYSSSIRRHYLGHLQIKKFTCPICDRKFVDKSSRDKHQRIHSK